VPEEREPWTMDQRTPVDVLCSRVVKDFFFVFVASVIHRSRSEVAVQRAQPRNSETGAAGEETCLQLLLSWPGQGGRERKSGFIIINKLKMRDLL
jgi:hypothetical protein